MYLADHADLIRTNHDVRALGNVERGVITRQVVGLYAEAGQQGLDNAFDKIEVDRPRFGLPVDLGGDGINQAAEYLVFTRQVFSRGMKTLATSKRRILLSRLRWLRESTESTPMRRLVRRYSSSRLIGLAILSIAAGSAAGADDSFCMVSGLVSG